MVECLVVKERKNQCYRSSSRLNFIYHTNDNTVEVYPRPNGEIYICGIGGSDYISKTDLKEGAFRNECNAKDSRVEAAMSSFQEMSATYQNGELDRAQACMRPCPPDALPYMGTFPSYEGAYINAGHNCWYVFSDLVSTDPESLERSCTFKLIHKLYITSNITILFKTGALLGLRLAVKQWPSWSWTERADVST